MLKVQPGDVLCTRSNKGWPAFMIRLGAAFRDLPNTVNHVAIVSHVDEAGTVWCIEARPGGVGYQAATGWLRSPWTINNALQPKTAEQREQVVEVAKGMLGTPYDWRGIVREAMISVGVQNLWMQDKWGKQGPPAQTICSALADYVYTQVGLASPDELAMRYTQPADWAKFSIENRYHLSQ